MQMLDAWIIEKIKEKERELDDRPRIELPDPNDYPCIEEENSVPSEVPRGVIIIKYGDDE